MKLPTSSLTPPFSLLLSLSLALSFSLARSPSLPPSRSLSLSLSLAARVWRSELTQSLSRPVQRVRHVRGLSSGPGPPLATTDSNHWKNRLRRPDLRSSQGEGQWVSQ